MSEMGLVLIPVPKVIREKLGDDGAEELVKMINDAVQVSRNDAIKAAERTSEKLIGESNLGLVKYIGEVESRLTRHMSEVESRLTWKMFGFWAGQFVIMLALFGFFFHFAK